MATRLSEIRELYAYDDWARERLLESASRLSHDQLTRDVGGSFVGVLGTLTHILKADWAWLSRWQGQSPGAWPEAWPVADLPSLVSHWRRVAQERAAFLRDLREADLDRVVDYRNLRGEALRSTMSEMLRHVVNHASYHRGQAADRIRIVGGDPVSTDLIVWYRERPAPVATASPLL